MVCFSRLQYTQLLCLDYSGLFIEAVFCKLYLITAQKSFTARSNDRVRSLVGLKSEIGVPGPTMDLAPTAVPGLLLQGTERLRQL